MFGAGEFVKMRQLQMAFRHSDWVEPDGFVERLGAEIDAVTKEPETRAKIAELGGMPPGLTSDGGTAPEAFEKFVQAEIAKWGEVVRRSGATVE